MSNSVLPAADEQNTWLDQPLLARLRFNWETAVFALLIIAAFLTRFYLLEERVMSHDETSHVYFSWLLSQGRGYAHDPVTHGPFQFHIVALSYFLFGESDTSARIPAVLFSIATVAFAWAYRRYLGRAGALLATLLLIISPYVLYYGRYVRNEAFVGLYFMLGTWAILRYLESGEARYGYWLTLAIAMHFTTKETSFIYAAQALLFLGLYFVYRVSMQTWPKAADRSRFLSMLIVAALLFGGALGYHEMNQTAPVADAAVAATTGTPITGLLVLAGLGAALVGVFFLIRGYGAEQLRQERSFSLMLLLGTLVLPHLTPFILSFIGWPIPNNAAEVAALALPDMLRIAAVVIPTLLLSAGIGLWWNSRQWLINAAIFWGIFVVLFTTFFTHAPGFFTGLIGSLGYWISQQDVQRGSQPLYYYALLQIPIYEFLPALGLLLASGVRIVQTYVSWIKSDPIEKPGEEINAPSHTPPVFALLLYWSLTSLAAFSIAGEKMPWLTFHITLPMILLTAWGLNQIIEKVDWSWLKRGRAWLILVLLPVFIASFSSAIGSLLFSSSRPFQGSSLAELSATSSFVIGLGVAISVLIALAFLLKDWPGLQMINLFILAVFGLLAVLTARAAFRASYINYDNATEYLVYAHSGPGVKEALRQIEDISRRTSASLDIVIAYDNETTYPYWWYLRNYPNARFFGAEPTRDLRDAPMILVGDANAAKLEPIVGKAYDRFDYIRIWWPNQDYYGLTWERFRDALTNPEMRAAIFKIWLNRDYTDYARLTNSQSMSLSNWQPSARMRLYIRKDVTAKLWDYGSAPVEEVVVADPYEGKGTQLEASLIFDSAGLFNRPRGIAVAPDGSLYITDSSNHRVLHMSVEGEVLHTWGSFGNTADNTGADGTFNEPWGIAVGPDGFVYVADTWNHRIQKFTAEGKFVTKWGVFGQAESPDAFWGPRDVTVDNENRVYVSDTGNKRIAVFDSRGGYITSFGNIGYQPGEFDEPVGIAITRNGNVLVADTWNQRIQSFAAQAGQFLPAQEWEIVGWYGESLDNKPYLTVNENDDIFITDPDGQRILQFNREGRFIRYWGEFGSGPANLNLPTGIADTPGGLWVVDSGNNRVLYYDLSKLTIISEETLP